MTIHPAPKPKPKEKSPRRPLPKQSRRKQQQTQGKMQFSTIRGPRQAVKKTNPRRKVSEFARCYHSKERVAWVKSRPCLVANGYCTGPIENAHVVGDGSNGMGRKAGFATIAPLCTAHHRSLHAIGAAPFQSRYGVSLAFAAAQTELAWRGSGEREQ